MAAEFQMKQYVPIAFVRALGQHVLDAFNEEDFSERLVAVLRDQADCDAVILRLLDRRIEVRAVATKAGTEVLPPAQVWEPFTEQDQQLMLQLDAGMYCEDVANSPYVKPAFRRHALDLGMRAGLMAPLVYNGELYGQIVFGWTFHRPLSEEARGHLRGLTDIACYHFISFWTRAAQQYDVLTGLRNRLGLERLWSRRGQDEAGALIFVDLDGFRSVVSSRGHLEGDDYLRRISQILTAAGPPGTSVFRVGGDEFVVLAPGFDARSSEDLVNEIRQRVHDLAGEVPSPRPAATMGVVRYPDEGTELNELLALADGRMRQARRRRSAFSTSFGGGEVSVPAASSDGNGARRAAVGAAAAAASAADAEEQDGELQLQRAMETGIGSAHWIASWPDGILVTKADLTVIYVNRAYEKMTGYTLNEWLGKTPTFVASGKTPKATYKQMWSELNEAGSWSGHVINRRKDGTEWVSFVSIIRIVSPDDRLIGYLANARDVSDSLWLEQPGVQVPFQEAFTQEALAFALAEAGQIHEGGSRRHLERIRDYTRMLVLGAMYKGYESHEALQRYDTRTAIVMASILHDIGKLAVPQSLLRKPGRLTKEEYDLVKTHTTAGRRLLESPYLGFGPAAPNSTFLTIAAEIAQSHHEWWDGRGYPEGLAGEDIPLSARIVAIADVYDALRSSRPYKRSWSHEEATEYIAKSAGTQFDPELVEIFLEMAPEFDALSREIGEDIPQRVDGLNGASNRNDGFEWNHKNT